MMMRQRICDSHYEVQDSGSYDEIHAFRICQSNCRVEILQVPCYLDLSSRIESAKSTLHVLVRLLILLRRVISLDAPSINGPYILTNADIKPLPNL